MLWEHANQHTQSMHTTHCRGEHNYLDNGLNSKEYSEDDVDIVDDYVQMCILICLK